LAKGLNMKKIISALFPFLILFGCQSLPEVDTMATCLKYCGDVLSQACRPGNSEDPFSDKCKKEKEEELLCEDQCR
jgi:hypothetical protein